MAHLEGEAITSRCRQHPNGQEAGELVLEWLSDFYVCLVWKDAYVWNEMPVRWQMAMRQISSAYHRSKM